MENKQICRHQIAPYCWSECLESHGKQTLPAHNIEPTHLNLTQTRMYQLFIINERVISVILILVRTVFHILLITISSLSHLHRKKLKQSLENHTKQTHWPGGNLVLSTSKSSPLPTKLYNCESPLDTNQLFGTQRMTAKCKQWEGNATLYSRSILSTTELNRFGGGGSVSGVLVCSSNLYTYQSNAKKLAKVTWACLIENEHKVQKTLVHIFQIPSIVAVVLH